MLLKKNLFVIFFLLPAFISVAQDQPAKTLADKIVAVVGDRIILYSDIQNAVSALREKDIPADAECLITEQAILSKLLMLQAEKDSLPVTDEEVEAELERKVRYYINQFHSKEMVELYAGKSIYQLKEDSRQPVREKMLEENMMQKIISGVKITPAEVRSFFDRIPKDSLPFFESELEIGHIILYPSASKEMEQYIVNEFNNYKKQVESKKITFCQLAKTIDKDECDEFEINRNDKTSFDPAFVAAAFRLKEGEVSSPVKTKFWYHLIQTVKKNGDDATVRHIVRAIPVTDAEIELAKNKLDSIRLRIVAGKIGFNEAASKYSDDHTVKFSPFIVNSYGSASTTIDQLDKNIVSVISKMNVGDISSAGLFINEQNKKGVRVLYLKSRSEPHIMNLRDDYNKISQMALDQKRAQALDKWMKTKVSSYCIMIDDMTFADCPGMLKYANTDKGF